MTSQLDNVTYGKSPSRPVTARCVRSAYVSRNLVSIKEEGVDDGLFRISLLNLLSFNQEANSLMSEELYCRKKNSTVVKIRTTKS